MIRASYLEGAFYALMVGMAESFALFYAVHSKLPLEKIALLSTVPVLVGSLSQWIIPQFVQSQHLRRAKLLGYLTQIVGLTLLVVSTQQENFYPWMFAALIFYWAGGMASGPLWLQWISQEVPRNAFRMFLSKRNGFVALLTVTAYIATASFIHPEPSIETFCIVFSLGTLARIASYLTQWWISRPHPSQLRHHVPQGEFSQNPNTHNSAVLVMIVCTVIFRFAVTFSSPFFLPYMVQEKSYGILEYVALTSIPFVGRFLFLSGWGRASQDIRPFLGIQVSALGVAFIPALWASTDSLALYMVYELFSGILWGGFELCTVLVIQKFWGGNTLKTLGMHMSLMNAVSVAGAWVGSQILASGMGYKNLFLISSGCRLLAVFVMIYAFSRLKETRFRFSAYGEYLTSVLSLRPAVGSVGRILTLGNRIQSKRQRSLRSK